VQNYKKGFIRANFLPSFYYFYTRFSSGHIFQVAFFQEANKARRWKWQKKGAPQI